MRRYYQYRDYLAEVHGAPLQRVPIDLGLGCPHRDADGLGGCTFCPGDGARADQTRQVETIEAQVDRGIEFARRRYGATRFMAYVQAFTGTLAPVERQRQLYRGLLERFPFDAVNIGTRPDCLGPDVLEFLSELSHSTDLWIELGIQTIHDRTLERINRGHDWACSQLAVRELSRRNINVAAHVILGLPGETGRHFCETAETLAELPLKAVKIHNLLVLKTTALAAEYTRQPFALLDEEDYADALIKFLQRLPATMPIMRLVTDAGAGQLIAPRWLMKKGQFLDYLDRMMELRGARQGDLRL